MSNKSLEYTIRMTFFLANNGAVVGVSIDHDDDER